MHARPAPTLVPLLCPAMLLLALLVLARPTPTTAVAVNTSPPCAPAPCGDLTVAYPFWLADTHQPYCGYKAFQVTCEERKRLYLKNSYWTYQVLDISYENSSFVVTNVNLPEDGSYCGLNLIGNASSDLSAAPFKISNKNQELFFLSNCQAQARQLPPSWAPVNCGDLFAWLAGNYSPDDNPKQLPWNCTVASLMPVLGYQGAAAADYDRLIKGGFLLEHNYTEEDCTPCTESGGQCRVDAGEDVLQCQCSDGVDWYICGAGACRSRVPYALVAKPCFYVNPSAVLVRLLCLCCE